MSRTPTAPAAPETGYDLELERQQAGLVATYQAALKRADGDRSAVDQVGLDALEQLVASVDKLFHKILGEKVNARFGGRGPDGVYDDAYAEMVAATIEAAVVFDPARCAGFYSWVTGTKGAARLAMYAAFENASSALSGLDKRQRRALGIARNAEAHLRRELGREPSLKELQDGMWDYCYAYQFERLTPAQQQLPEDEWKKLAKAKIVNSGLQRGITDIQLLRLADAPTVSEQDFATGWDFVESARAATAEQPELPASMADLAALALAGLGPTDRQIVADRLLTTGPESSLNQVAARFRVPVSHVKDLVAGAGARMQAAHAHFAFLAPGLSTQFETAPVPAAGGAAAALLARLQPSLA